MARTKKCQLRTIGRVLKTIVMVLILKVGFGSFDMGSDIVNGYRDHPFSTRKQGEGGGDQGFTYIYESQGRGGLGFVYVRTRCMSHSSTLEGGGPHITLEPRALQICNVGHYTTSQLSLFHPVIQETLKWGNSVLFKVAQRMP